MKNKRATKSWSERFVPSDKLYEALENFKLYDFIVLHGAAQVGKSAIAALLFATMILSSGPEDNLFLSIGFSSASAKNNIARCGGFGLKDIFDAKCKETKYYGKEALKINVNGVEKIVVFSDGGTVSSGNSIHGFPASGILIDECDRISKECFEECLQRIQAHPKAKIIFTMNPANRNHYVYKMFDMFKSKGRLYFENFTFNDNPALSQEQKDEIMSRYDPETPYYKRFVLGEIVDIEGLIYKLHDKNIIDSKNYKYQKYVVVADPGVTKSLTGFSCVAMTYNEETTQLECHVTSDYGQRNKDVTNRDFKTSADMAELYVQFIRQCMTKLGRAPEAIYVDTNPDFFVEVTKSLANNGLGYMHVDYALKNYDDMKVEDRIRWSSSSIFNGRLRFDKSCEETIKEFKETVYDPKAILNGKEIYWDEPANEAAPHIDLIDACLYGYRHFKDTIDNQYRYR